MISDGATFDGTTPGPSALAPRPADDLKALPA